MRRGDNLSIVCPYDACEEGKMCPNAMKVALATDLVGPLWGDGMMPQ